MPTLTPGQRATLKTAIQNDAQFNAFVAISDWPAIGLALNAPASPNFFVWQTAVDVQKLRAAITWANLTPADAPDGTQTWMNRSLQCQGKQFNIQCLLPFSGAIDCTDANFRAGMQDALQAVRSGAGGASQGAGWAGVQNAMARTAKYGEKVFSDTTNGNGSTRALSAKMTYEGDVSDEDIRLAMTT